MSAQCTCGETACESELCDCDKTPCPVDHAFEAEVLREAAAKIRRAYSGDEPDHSWVNSPFDAAGLIDPDKDN